MANNELTVKQVAEQLNTTEYTIRKYIKLGKLAATKHPKGFQHFYTIKQKDIDNLIKQMKG